MSHFTLGVVNVGGGECRGGECRTIPCWKSIFTRGQILTAIETKDSVLRE